MTTNVIGRFAVVRHGKKFLTVSVIDAVAGENKAKRVRIQKGPRQGEVLMPSEYQFMEFIDAT